MDNEEIATIEHALRSSLQHVPAPEGFHQRLTARIAEREANQQVRTARSATGVFLGGFRRAAWGTAIAAMLALAAGTDVLYLRHERQQATAAQAKVDYAMQLTTHALDEVEMGVNRSPAGRFAQLLNETSR